VVVDNGKLVGVLDVDARGHEIVPPEIPPALTTHALLKAVEASK
jgi:putative methionine-R-sulfoxide reductase with GAF domain